MEVTARALNPQATAEHRLEMRTPRDKGDLVPGMGKTSPEIAAEGTRPHDRDPHIRLPLASGQMLSVIRRRKLNRFGVRS